MLNVSVMKFPLQIIIVKKKWGYFVTAPALDISSQGDSVEHAKSMIKEAILLELEYHLESGTLGEFLMRRGFKLGGKPAPTTKTRDDEFIDNLEISLNEETVECR